MIIDYEDDGVIRWERNGEKKHAELIDLIEAYEAEPIEAKVAQEEIAYLKGYADGKAEPTKHGHWKWNKQYGTECSECGTAMFEVIGHIFSSATPKYCPYCGAKMDEVEE